MEVIAMKKVCSVLLVMMLLLCSVAFAEEGNVETFSAEYEMVGTTSSGQPKNDTFIFEGETTDGIITKLNFDIIRNKGSEDEYSKKDIMGYLMNVSDATVEKTEDGYRLATLSAYGYDPAYSDGDAYYAQYMLTASCDTLTEDTLFSDLTFTDLAQPGNVVTVEKACIAYGYLAREAGVELTPETPVKDLLVLHGLYADGAFVEGSNRVSFAGYNGGRSYGLHSGQSDDPRRRVRNVPHRQPGRYADSGPRCHRRRHHHLRRRLPAHGLSGHPWRAFRGCRHHHGK